MRLLVPLARSLATGSMKALVLCFICASVRAETPWGHISHLLNGEFAGHLPTVPLDAHGAAVYGDVASSHSDGMPFASYTIDIDELPAAPTGSTIVVAGSSAVCNTTEPTAIEAGPSFTCQEGYCSGPGLSTGDQVCRAKHGVSGSPQVLSLGGREGTYWAPALAAPAWAQYLFPATPTGTSTLTLRYTLDSRYRPELYGGNPCANASADYNCTLCTKGPWDFKQPPGLWILWSAAGRQEYIVSGPFSDHAERFDDDVVTHVLDAPAELDLRDGEFPVVTFFTVSQCMRPCATCGPSHPAIPDVRLVVCGRRRAR